LSSQDARSVMELTVERNKLARVAWFVSEHVPRAVGKPPAAWILRHTLKRSVDAFQGSGALLQVLVGNTGCRELSSLQAAMG